MVEAGQTFSLPLGPPLVPTAGVAQTGEIVRLDYRLAGRSGERYAPAVTKGNSRVAPPQVEIADSTGKVIYSGNFAYG